MSIILKNVNKGNEMVEIMELIHHYVPMVETPEDVLVPSLNEQLEVKKATSFPIILDGDYLMAAKEQGAQRTVINSESPSSQLEGLVLPAAADWHTKLKLLCVCYNINHI